MRQYASIAVCSRLLAAAIWLAVSSWLAFAVPASATTYVLGPDEALLRQADLVVEIEVLEARALVDEQPPATEYLALPRRVVKGTPDASPLAIRLPGAVGEHASLRIPGVPRLAEGERYLAFLAQRPNHTYGVLHWGMGLFRRVETEEATVAARRLDGARVLALSNAPDAAVARDWDLFLGWLVSRSRGGRAAPDYFTTLGADAYEAAFTLFESDGLRMRWFEFDGGRPVRWRMQAGAGRAIESFRQGLEAWSVDARSTVQLEYAGRTHRTAAFSRPDGVTAIVFDDPRNEVDGTFSCEEGGVLAAGGPWIGNETRRFKGRRYLQIGEAEVVVNDGADCFLAGRPDRSAEVFVHELGHTLGIGHSCGDQESGSCNTRRKDVATMRAAVHDDGRGAEIRGDDRQAARRLYSVAGGGGGGAGGDDDGDDEEGEPLGAPTQLRASATSPTTGTLTWRDNATREVEYQIFARTRSGSWTHWVDAPANTTSIGFVEATPGVQYVFRVRARRGKEFSDWSNVARVTMPGGGGGGGQAALGAPSDLTARATSTTEGDLAWRDNSSAETAFEIWLRIGSGSWSNWTSVGANSTSIHFIGATPGQTYHFQVRALRGSDHSDFSNVAKVTMGQ